MQVACCALDRNGSLYEDREDVEEDEQDPWANIYLSVMIGRWRCPQNLVPGCIEVIHCPTQPATGSILNRNHGRQNKAKISPMLPRQSSNAKRLRSIPCAGGQI